MWITFDNKRNRHEEIYIHLRFRFLECKYTDKRKTYSRNYLIYLRIYGFDSTNLPEFQGGRNVSTIQEFSSGDLMDARDPPLSSHIF